MLHWSQLAIRNWRARWTRTLGAVAAIALGTAAVVWVTCCYESVRRTVNDWAAGYVGNAHVTVSSPLGKYDQIPQRIINSLSELENVKCVAPRLIQRLRAEPWSAKLIDRDDLKPQDWTSSSPEVDLYGIDLAVEPLVREHRIVAGRMLTEDAGAVCVLDEQFASEARVGVGDYLLVWTETRERPYEIEIVGLHAAKRVGRLQKPVALMTLKELQRMRSKFALITSADVVLKDASEKKISVATSRVRTAARKVSRNAVVRSVAGRMKQIERAQSQQQFVLMMLSCVAMLTALITILSTLSMGMIERIGQLGLMRCIGVTRTQLAIIVLLEVMPLGVIGVLLGVALGLGFTALSVALVPQYIGSFAISWSGIWLASAAGMITTLLAGVIPAVAALGVSPMEAARPRARQARGGIIFIAAVVALGLLLIQHFVLVERARRSTEFTQQAALAIIVLYFGYAAFAPILVRYIGAPAIWLAAKLMGVRPRLLQDQVGQAAWRSAGVCCGLMVGLSLIVAVFVVNQSITRGWQFPKEFPEAYLWSFEQFTPRAKELIAEVPGIKEFTVGNSVNVIVEERPIIGEELLLSVTWFLGSDPDTFLDLVKLDFLEGDEATAREKLKAGGHIIVADDFARSRNKHLGDEVKVYFGYGAVMRTYKVAGVVRSPSLDIAAGFFQLQTEYGVAAAGSVVGTNEDLKKALKIDGAKLVLLNFDLKDEPVPPDWPPPRDTPEGRRLDARVYDETSETARRWRRHREEQVLSEIRTRLRAPQVFSGTVGELKDEIDRNLQEITQLFTAIPGIALLVAAVGVANLMMANVTARSKQLAILRAVGGTRGLLLRMVVAEALVLGLVGGGLGLALGMHLAYDITDLVARMWGFSVAVEFPTELLARALLVTVGLCILAGIMPARRAARADVVEALHVA